MTARLLLALGLFAASHASGQATSAEVGTVAEIIDLGIYDPVSGTFEAPSPGDDDTSATLLFDNGVASSDFYTIPFADEVHLARVVDPVELSGATSVSQIVFGYGSSAFGTTDFTLNFHVGVGPDGEGGTSWPFEFTDMPGGDETGNPLGYVMAIDLTDLASDDDVEGGAIVVTDGRFGLSMQTPNQQTGPLWADVTAETNPFDPDIDVYDVDTSYEYSFTFEDFTPSPVLQVSGAPLRVTEGDRVPPTASRGRDVLGSITDPEEERRVRFEGIEGERMTVQVRRQKGSGLRPLVEIVDVASGEVVDTAGKGGGNARTRFEVPRTSLYEMRITSSDGVPGSFVARVRSRPPRVARRPEEPSAPNPAEPPKVVFPGRGVGRLSATIEPAESTEKALTPPFLRTDAGDYDFGDSLAQIGNEFEIEDFELPTLGGYQLIGGDVFSGDQVAQTIKARVRFAKQKKSERFTAATDDLDLVGHWLREDFVTVENSSRYVFDLDRSNGRSRLVVVDGGAITTKSIDEWRVFPSFSGLPGARFVELEVGEILTESGAFTSTSKGGFEVLEYFHPDGDPNRIQFVESGVVWRRATTGLPPVSELSAEGLTVFDGDFGVASDLPVFTMTCPEGAAWFEVFRAEGGGARPSAPRDVVEARCTGGDANVRRYIDFDAEAGVTYRYWVAVLDAEGRRGPISAPVDVAVPSEEL